MEDIEIWKPVKGYEGLYEVSDCGKVRNLNYKKKGRKREKSPQVLRNGYFYVVLFKNGAGRRFAVHRLVANAFIPNPYNLPEVDHIDTDKLNNRAKNLRWVTHRENSLNETTRAKNSAKWKGLWASGRMDGCKKRVIQMTRDGCFVREWESARKAADCIGAPHVGVIRVCLGKRKHCRGYKWMYKEDYDNRDATAKEKA